MTKTTAQQNLSDALKSITLAPSPDGVKNCLECKRVLPCGDFYRSKTGLGGVHARCKRCVLEKRRLSRIANGDPVLPFCDIDKKIKECVTCKQVLSFESFGPRKNHRGGRSSRCRACDVHEARHWLYGIDAVQYKKMLAEQRGLCAICGKHMKKPQVDHCHVSGAVRGLLCNRCNTGIGMLGDSLKNIESAKTYLMRYHNEQASIHANVALAQVRK